jgi:NosR/NirI family nitrous oxide reductase transcriptional regulator
LRQRRVARLILLLVSGAIWGGAAVSTAVAASRAPEGLDCAAQPCAEVLPGAVEFQPVEGKLYRVGVDEAGEVVGWIALSTDFVDIKAYSGKPLVTLVGLNPDGIITGARVIHHSEPILLVGIPESALHEFVDFYAGKRAVERIVVGRARDADAVAVDAISGATVTVLAQNHTILEAARRVGADVGVISVAAIVPGRFLKEPEPWTFARMWEEGVFGRLRVTEKEMGEGESDRPFIDLLFTIADAPHIGRALLGDHDYEHKMGQLVDGEHLVVILGMGSGSFKGSGFVRGGIFDRVRLGQALREITFRDTDYWNLPDTAMPDAPAFNEGAIFVARGGLLDPGDEFDLIFLGSRYDRRSAFSREFREFRSTLRLPDTVYEVDRPAAEMIWRQAWHNRRTDSIVLIGMLVCVAGVFVARRYTTADMKRLERLHLISMVLCFLVIGVYMRAQPSVTQILTLVEAVRSEWRWELFLSEPLIFILWIFIAVVSVVWGRGVFCGWVCPYGALNELVFKVGQKLGIRTYELPDGWHRSLRYLRYAILFGLIPIFLWDSLLGERLAEVEPFKSTFLVPAWTRSPGFLAWWSLLLVASFFMYRPFCRYVCPMGAGLSLMSSFRPAGPKRREFCSSCKICTRGCEPRAIGSDGRIDPRECLSCMECEANYRDAAVCPPLIGITRLESIDGLSVKQQEKLEELRVEVRDA